MSRISRGTRTSADSFRNTGALSRVRDISAFGNKLSVTYNSPTCPTKIQLYRARGARGTNHACIFIDSRCTFETRWIPRSCLFMQTARESVTAIMLCCASMLRECIHARELTRMQTVFFYALLISFLASNSKRKKYTNVSRCTYFLERTKIYDTENSVA